MTYAVAHGRNDDSSVVVDATGLSKQGTLVMRCLRMYAVGHCAS